jgi:Fe(3+) dicitrate transport protein
VSQGIQSKVELKVRTGPIQHQLEYGIRFHNDRVERRHSQDAFFFVGGELVPAGQPTDVTAFNEALTDALALHAFDALTWQRLTVTPGVRVELIRWVYRDRANGASNGDAQQIALPGVGAFYALTDAFGVLGGVYRGMTPAAPELLNAPEPEVSVNYEAGARLTTGAVRAELIGYFNDYSNLTTICTFSQGCREEDLDTQTDAGAAHIYGLESLIEVEAPLTASLKLPLRATYTLTRSEFLEDFDATDPSFGSVRSGYELPYVPRHQAVASVGLEASRAGGYVAGNYVSKMRETAGDAPLEDVVTTDEQFTVDAGAHFKPFEFLKIYGHVRNLFDEMYIVSRRPYGARPNAPRWVQVGVKAEF